MERKYNPTARSPELLVRILRIYPILESLLSVSHRSGITHLAQTSKTLRNILTSDVPRLLKPFRSCKHMTFCGMCNTVVCVACVVPRCEPGNYGFGWGKREYVLVGGHTEALRQEIVSKLRSMGSPLDRHCYQFCKRSDSCEACDSQRRKPREWLTPAMAEIEFQNNRDIGRFGNFQLIMCPDLNLEHIPHIERTCACNGFQAGCKAPLHIVPTDSLPMGSELVGMLQYGDLSQQLRFELDGGPSTGWPVVPFYLLPGQCKSGPAHSY